MVEDLNSDGNMEPIKDETQDFTDVVSEKRSKGKGKRGGRWKKRFTMYRGKRGGRGRGGRSRGGGGNKSEERKKRMAERKEKWAARREKRMASMSEE